MTNIYIHSLPIAFGILVFFMFFKKNNKRSKDAQTQVCKTRSKDAQTQVCKTRSKDAQTQVCKIITKDAQTQVEFDISDFIMVDYCPRV